MRECHRATSLGGEEPCPYLPGQTMRLAFFLADAVGPEELDALLAGGWRLFGHYYFRPACPSCRACVPLRVLAHALVPTASQRRVLKRNHLTEVKVGPLEFREEVFGVYEEHSRSRFGKTAHVHEFLFAHYSPSCDSLQSEYTVDGRLAAVGFLSRSVHALSSVYFVFDSRSARLSPGVFSVFAESRWAVQQGLEYYYLGYWIAANRSMRYKADYGPHETRDWDTGEWVSGT
jgi:arginine-tRNA-protein transferase